MFDFAGKRVLVTGGSRGIGRAIARGFADSGARVAVGYRQRREEAEAVVADLEGDGHVTSQGDVSTPEGAEKTVTGAIEGLGGLDIAVNNAGVAIPHPPATTAFPEWLSAWQRTLDANLVGAANVCYFASRHMMSQGGGRIVNVSSRGAFRGEPDYPAYGASKAGLNALSQSLAIALAPQNIFVGVVAPGFVDTDMAGEILDGEQGDAVRAQSPLGRIAQPGEVAHAVLFLASEGAEFTTGAILDVNGASYLRS